MKPKCYECDCSLNGKGRVFGLCDSCLREALDGGMEYRAEKTAAASRAADKARAEWIAVPLEERRQILRDNLDQRLREWKEAE